MRDFQKNKLRRQVLSVPAEQWGSGSSIRGGRDTIVAGATVAAVTASDGATATLTITAQRPCVLEHIVLGANAAVALVAGNDAGLAGTAVTSIALAGRQYVNGSAAYVSGEVFSAYSRVNPVFGVGMDSTNSMVILLANYTGAGIETWAGCTLL